jgi:hypothetical protein
MASFVAREAAMYFASIVNSAIVDFFCLTNL